MSKKIFSAFTLVAFMLAMSVAAYAVNVSAKLDGNGAKASLSVTADGVTLTNQAWANNAAAIYRIGDHDVSVAIKGNKVDKVAYVGKAPEVPQGDEGAEIVDVFATPAPVAAVAFNALANPDEPVVESKVNATTPLASLKGAGFHCNADGKFGEDGYFVSQGGGKGRVWPSLPAPWGEVKNVNNSVYLYLSSVPGTTKWDLDDIFDVKTGVSMGLPVCPNCGSTLWVSYSNNSGIPDGKNVQFQHPPKGDDDGKLLGAPSLTKTVDGQFFAEWAVDNDVDVFEILASISFKAYAVDGEGADFDRDAPFAVGELDLNGVITFVPNEFPAGWYAIVEEYVPGSYAEEIFEEVNDPLYVEIGASGKIVGGGNFDYQGVYVMANEPGDKMWLTPAMTIGGHPVYDFHVRNVATGEQISSFCAAADVLHGTGAEEMKEQKFENKDEVIKMLNYIYDNYGSIDQWPKPGDCEGFKFYGSDDPHFAQWNTPNGERYGTKLIAQLCLGALLGDGSPALVDNVGSDRVIASAINSAVADVLANFATATVGNNIIDVVYLAKNEEIGWNDPQPQLVPVYAPTFNNTPKNPGGEKGTLSLTKTVDGVFIAEWAFDKGYDFDEVMEILAGISFVATSVDTGETFQSGPVDPSGQILFDDVPAGWYKVEEVLTGLAADIFENVGPKYFYVDKDGVFGETTFDYDAYYTIVNGHGSGYTLGYGGLNNSGDIFPIHVDNAVTGERFASFCANAGSTNFAEGHANYYVAGSFSDYLAYYVANGVDIGHFLSAYNYIEDNYGNLDDLRPVTQIVTWALLGELGGKGIDHNTDAFNDINWAAIAAGSPGVPGVANAKVIVVDVLENYAGYWGKGLVVDVVFMESLDGNYITGQPQLVPVYGEATFNNKPRNPGEENSAVSFNKVKYGGLVPIDKLEEFGFDLFKIVNGEEVYHDTYYTDPSGEVMTEELAPGKYVFRELPALLWETGSLDEEVAGGASTVYNLVWMPQYPGGADGLYFTIDAKGDVEWENDFNGTLNNVVACKHNILWGAGDIFYSSVDHDFITVEGMPGFIAKFHDWCHGTLEVRNNCGWLDILWLGCSDNCGIGTGIQLAEPVLFECDNPKWVGILADDDPEGYKWDYDSEGVYRAVARHSVCEGCGSYTLIECSADYVAGIEWKEY